MAKGSIDSLVIQDRARAERAAKETEAAKILVRQNLEATEEAKGITIEAKDLAVGAKEESEMARFYAEVAASESLSVIGVNPKYISHRNGVKPSTDGAEERTVGAYFNAEGNFQKLLLEDGEWVDYGKALASVHFVNNRVDNETAERILAINYAIGSIAGGYQGPIKISDTPTIDGVYIPTESGTYPNAGGLTYSPEQDEQDEGMTVSFIKSGSEWSKNAVFTGIPGLTDVQVIDDAMYFSKGDGTIIPIELPNSESIDDGYVEDDTLFLTFQGDIVVEVPLPAGGGGGGGSAGISFKVQSISPTSFSTSDKGTTALEFTWTSIDKEDEMDTGDGSLELVAGGKLVRSMPIPQGRNTIDITNYLISGANSLSLIVSDSYGNTRTIRYTVNSVSLEIKSSYDPATINSGDITFRFTPIGNTLKTVHFELDGVEIATKDVITSNSQITQIIPAQAHGIHPLRVYMTANVGGTLITSNELYFDVISVVAGNTEVLISSTYDVIEMEQYQTIAIPYTVYDPSKGTADVDLYVDDVLVQSVSVGRDIQTWNYKPSNFGTSILKIVSGASEKIITANISESEIQVEAVTEDLVLFLNASNRSNAETTTRNQWKYENIEAVLSNFNFSTDGWKEDKDGSTALRVANDATVTIPFKLFATDPKTAGKTIEVEFMTSDVSNTAAVIISSMAGNIGFQITAEEALFKSSQSTVDAKFKADERVRIAFVISKIADARLIQVYLNGIYSGVQSYPLSDNFVQTPPQDITIGSPDCTVNIYNIRVYENNLNQYQLLDNYIADMDNIDRKVEVYNRNQMYDSFGNISYDRAVQHIPCMIIEGPLPVAKGNKVDVNVYYENLQDPSKSYQATGAQIDVQGTSSQYYPRKNFKIKHNGGFETPEGFSSKYKLREDSIPEKTFTYKADFAESSGTHNTGLAVYYEWAWRELGFATPPQEVDPNIRTTVDGFPILIFHRTGPNEYLEFVGKYNFNNDKTEATFGFEPGMVSWESKNNGSDRVLFKDNDYETLDSEGKFEWLGDWEDRYPDDGYDNPEKLKRLATWIISCKNNPTKFRNEIASYFDLDSMLFYYIMTEFTAGVDQRGKNMFLTFYDSAIDAPCYFLFYDNDTVFGIGNTGKLQFDYSVEYHDDYGSGKAWNAEGSELWKLVEDAFPAEIKALYRRMRSEGVITYDKLIEFLDVNHSSKWSESIYNEDGKFKYIEPYFSDDPKDYLYALQGSREEHRKFWIFNRVLYLDSKYNAASNLTDFVSFRLYADSTNPWTGVEPSVDFTLTAIKDGYARVDYGDGSFIAEKRIKRNVTEFIAGPTNISANDLETVVYGAQSLKSLGDLSSKYLTLADLSKAINITELIIGSTIAGYENPKLDSLTLGANKLLKYINLANCTGLNQTVDLSGCISIEEIEATGSAITGVTLPDGGSLHTLSLPAVPSLILKNQTRLDNAGITLDSYDNLDMLIVENCPNMDAFALLDIAPITKLRLTGLNGSGSSTANFEKAILLGGAGPNGETLPQSYLQGTWHFDVISYTDLVRYQNAWGGNLEITADEVLYTTNMTFNKDSGFDRLMTITPTETFTMRVNYGGNIEQYNVFANAATGITVPDLEYSDTEVNLYNGNKLKALGDLSTKFLGMLDIKDSTTIEKLIIGSKEGGYSNPNFTELNLGVSNTALTEINIAKCTNFNSILDLTETPNVTKVYAGGTKIPKVIAPTNVWSNLELPDTITELRLTNQPNLTDSTLVLEGKTNITKLVLDNVPNLTAAAIAKGCINLTHARITGLNELNEKETFEKLLSIGGIDANGNTTAISHLVGTWHFDALTQDEFDAYSTARPNLTVTAGIISDTVTMVINSGPSFNANLQPISIVTQEIVTTYGNNAPISTNLIANVQGSVTAPVGPYTGASLTIEGGSLLKKIGDLSRAYVGYVDISKNDHLEELILGKDEYGYVNNELATILFSNTSALKKINISNCTNYTDSFDLGDHPNIKEFLSIGSGLSGLTWDQSIKLNKLTLPDSITSLELDNQSSLTYFKSKGLTSLVIDGSVGSVSASLITRNANLASIRWTNINETGLAFILAKIATLQGIDAFGNPCPIADAVSGTFYSEKVTQAQLDTITNDLPNVVFTYGVIEEPMIYTKTTPIGGTSFACYPEAETDKFYDLDGEWYYVPPTTGAFYDNVLANSIWLTSPNPNELSPITDKNNLTIEIPLNNVIITKLSNMSSVFSGKPSFNQDISNWDVSSVTDMNSMFRNNASFNQDISNWDVSSVTDMSYMFYNVTSFNKDIGSWDVSSVTNMSYMFQISSFNGDISNWDVSSVTNMNSMFYNDRVFNQDISNWDVSSVTNMGSMFFDARSFNQDIGSWDVSSVTNMSAMFRSASSFLQDIGNWDISSVTNISNFLLSVNISTIYYDSLLIGWSNNPNGVPSGLNFHGGNSKYSPTGKVGRDTLINTYGWTITDGGPV